MGVAMGVAMANEKADEAGIYSSSSGLRGSGSHNGHRSAAALTNVTLDDGGDGDCDLPAWMMSGNLSAMPIEW